MHKRRNLVGFLAAVAMLVLTAGVAVAATVVWEGGLCEGTGKPDKITGSASDDYIVARGSADAVDAGAGDDVVKGGCGNDRPGKSGDPSKILEGGPGNDTVMGGRGGDTVEDEVTGDKDRLFGGPDSDFVNRADGDTRCWTTARNPSSDH